MQPLFLLFFAAFLACVVPESSDRTPATDPHPMQTTPNNVLTTTTPPDNPVELGKVHWLRDIHQGTAEAQKTGKPLLILFQEVPGCSNCTQYGAGPLSHPLIVEAIENLFVPVCIYNNKGGADAEALRIFGEPAWNNPVVRIVRPNHQDIVPRMADFRSQALLVGGMLHALDLSGAVSPTYLALLEEELLAREAGLETATFSMYCFWSGEGTFGQIPGVIATEPGFQDGKEVVRVQYNPNRVSKNELEKRTQPKGIQACSGNTGFRSDREPKYYLAQTPWRFVPMTTLQSARANSLIGEGKSPENLLSPRQLALYQKVTSNPQKTWPNAVGVDNLEQAWAAAARF